MTGRLLLALLTVGSVFPAVWSADKDADPEPRPKVVKTASGLRYEELKEGKGKPAKKGDQVEVHYSLWLAANTKKTVDTSRGRGQAFKFTVGGGAVIKGFDEGVEGMKVGGKRKLLIPAKLGYGARGAGAMIPANADLVFEIELLAVN